MFGPEASGLSNEDLSFSNYVLQIPTSKKFDEKLIKEHIINALSTNLKTHNDLNDIINENIPAHDILCGGFPCQPFSIAGKKEGFQDPRSNVFWKILEILKYHKPNTIILENVKNLTSHDNGHTYYTIIQELISKNKSVVSSSKGTNPE